MTFKQIFTALNIGFVVFISAASSAEVFVWTDEHGNKTYGDTPQKTDNAQKVELEPITILGFPQQDASGLDQNNDDAQINLYKVFAISKPSNDQTVRDNTGNIQVSIQIEPELIKGHVIQLYLDNSKSGSAQASTSFLIKNIDRGSHSLSATLLDEKGNTLKQTGSTTFHLHRFIAK